MVKIFKRSGRMKNFSWNLYSLNIFFPQSSTSFTCTTAYTVVDGKFWDERVEFPNNLRCDSASVYA